MALKNWADIWGDIWGDIWVIEGEAPDISDGDEVQVLITGGIQCTVYHNTGTAVRVAIASAKQISVLHTGGTPIKVTI